MAKGIKLRSWSLDARDYASAEDFEAAVEVEAAKSVHLQERLGVALISTPFKQVIDEEYVTVAWHFQTATVPALRGPEPPEPEPSLVVVADTEADPDVPEAA